MSEKQHIPHTNPDWGLELPEGYNNSLVDANGRNHDDGYNFDEKDDDEDEKIPPFDPESAKKAREEAKKAAEKE
jgi:hypothetical protein